MRIKPNSIVVCNQGHHWLVLALLAGDRARVESVATKRVYVAPLSDLRPSDREPM